MRSRFYDVRAAKQSVSLTINTDLYDQARRLGIRASRVAEEVIAYETAKCRAERIRAEIWQDLEALDAYEAKHGSFAAMTREHYRADDPDDVDESRW